MQCENAKGKMHLHSSATGKVSQLASVPWVGQRNNF